MQGDQPVTGENGLMSTLKGVSVWILTAIANFLSGITASQVAVWLSIIYTTLLILDHLSKKFKTPPRQVRVTDVAETIHAKKIVVVTDEEPTPSQLPKD